MRAFYVTRTNMAFAALGVDPRYINQTHRLAAQALGQATGRTPQEAALLTVADFPATYRTNANPKVVGRWIKRGKLDVKRFDVRQALTEVGCGHLID